jgi:hypothetical protein
MEGWQSGQMQRTVTPSGKPYIGSNPIPSTTNLFLYMYLTWGTYLSVYILSWA